jgi:hypothetical protein
VVSPPTAARKSMVSFDRRPFDSDVLAPAAGVAPSASPNSPGVTLSDARTASPPATNTPPPPQTNAGAPSQNPNVDYGKSHHFPVSFRHMNTDLLLGKIGLLPKRPVSLLRDPPPAQDKAASAASEADEELEYTENPFEDERK